LLASSPHPTPLESTGSQPSAGTGSQSSAGFDANAAVATLLSSLQEFRDAGLIQQRLDGAFVLPGHKDSRWEERLKIGSTCACPSCTPHNQRHWVCMVCNSVHEWVLVADRPRTMRTQLGAGGVA